MCKEIEDAVSLLVQETMTQQKTENCPLTNALGRIVSEDLYAPVSQPPFDRSPLDGYALCSADTKGAGPDTPVTLQVTEEVMAGGVAKQEAARGCAIRIMTGAPIPKGADCVIRQEDTDCGEQTVRIYKALEPHANICDAGEDYKQGTCVISKGTKLDAVLVGVAASMGYREIPVLQQTKIALLTTGDEIIEPGMPLKPGKIYNANKYLLLARLAELGMTPVITETVKDSAEEVARAVEACIDEADCIITTGGVSVGKKDIMHEAIKILGARRLFWKVKAKPGTPVLASIYKGKPLISLSGNPFAALTNLELLVRPVLAAFGGDECIAPARKEAVMDCDFKKGSPTRRFVRACYDEGRITLPKGRHVSGVLASMAGCNCLIDIPAGTDGLQTGDPVSAVMLKPDISIRRNAAKEESSLSGRKKEPLLYAVSGRKNSGKTTLITQLIPELKKAGLHVATIKHDGHDFEGDVPGTDSYRHRQAGAYGTAIYSDNRFLILKQQGQITERDLVQAFPEADVILLEGFKNSHYQKYWCDYPDTDADVGQIVSTILDRLEMSEKENAERRNIEGLR